MPSSDCPEIQVILATANKKGKMLEGGPFDRHLEYLQRAYDLGKGLSIMKVIAAGRSSLSQSLKIGFAGDLSWRSRTASISACPTGRRLISMYGSRVKMGGNVCARLREKPLSEIFTS